MMHMGAGQLLDSQRADIASLHHFAVDITVDAVRDIALDLELYSSLPALKFRAKLGVGGRLL
jgi:hypothetical protein